jgi:leader peptidase (prepilin peptidase)/N-methyltransferase
MDFAALGDGPLLGLAIAVGLAVGSFLNVVIHRLPKVMEREWRAQCAELAGEAPAQTEPYSIVRPRSHCPHCQRPIRAVENIPVLSFLILRGRCRGCGAAIGWRYPAVEIVTAALFAACLVHFGPTAIALGAMAFSAAMVALAAIDFDTQYLPDDITLPLLWLGLALNAWLAGSPGTSPLSPDLASAVIGAMAGYLSLWLVYQAFKLATGKEGMGYGDFKLLAAIGAWLGWQMLPLVVLASSVVGAVIGMALIVLARRGRNVPMPFGPYLAAAGLIALFWGRPLTRAYLALL